MRGAADDFGGEVVAELGDDGAGFVAGAGGPGGAGGAHALGLVDEGDGLADAHALVVGGLGVEARGRDADGDGLLLGGVQVA
jgi:hypothetical protein